LDVKKKQYTEEQIIGFLREAAAPVCRWSSCAAGTGSPKGSYYPWRSKLGGMEVSDAKRLKTLEAENARLRKLLAEMMLETRCCG
jgi:putative transposase